MCWTIGAWKQIQYYDTVMAMVDRLASEVFGNLLCILTIGMLDIIIWVVEFNPVIKKLATKNWLFKSRSNKNKTFKKIREYIREYELI